MQPPAFFRTRESIWPRSLPGTARCNGSEVSSQGYMLASQDRLYVPTGRTAPAIFARADGKSLGSLPEGSGAAVLFDARDVVSGPSVRPPGVTFADAQSRETIAAFDALRVVVRGSTVYLQSEDKLTALDCAKYIALSRESKSLTEEEKRLNAARKAQEYGMSRVDCYVKGPGSGRETAIRAIQAAGLEVGMIKDCTPVPHNGCRPKKRRRV